MRNTAASRWNLTPADAAGRIFNFAIVSIGLALDILGVVLLFLYGLTKDIRRRANILLTVGRNEEEAKRWKRYNLITWFAMVMLVAGFSLQIAGNLLLMPTK